MSAKAAAILAAAFIAAAYPTGAEAGDRELAVIFVNMTPDGSGEPAKRCIAQLKAGFTKGDFVVDAVGEAKTRATIRRPKGGAHFGTWTAKDLGPLRNVGKFKNDYDTDAIVLADCRPHEEGGLLFISVYSAGGKHYIFSLLNTPLSPAVIKVAVGAMTSATWHDFSP